MGVVTFLSPHIAWVSPGARLLGGAVVESSPSCPSQPPEKLAQLLVLQDQGGGNSCEKNP